MVQGISIPVVGSSLRFPSQPRLSRRDRFPRAKKQTNDARSVHLQRARKRPENEARIGWRGSVEERGGSMRSFPRLLARFPFFFPFFLLLPRHGSLEELKRKRVVLRHPSDPTFRTCTSACLPPTHLRTKASGTRLESQVERWSFRRSFRRRCRSTLERDVHERARSRRTKLDLYVSWIPIVRWNLAERSSPHAKRTWEVTCSALG